MKKAPMKKIIVCIASLTLLLPTIDWSCDHPADDYVTLIAHQQSVTCPANVARLSWYIRNEPALTRNEPIVLTFFDKSLRNAFDLETIVALLHTAKERLVTYPSSVQESYMQLAQEKPLASLDDPKALLKLFIACDYLQIDCKESEPLSQHEKIYNLLHHNQALQPEDPAKLSSKQCIPVLHFFINQHASPHYLPDVNMHDEYPILKAIAYKMSQLLPIKPSGDISPLLKMFTATERNMCNDNETCFEGHIWPYVFAQLYLANRKNRLSQLGNNHFSTTCHDMCAHNIPASILENVNNYLSLKLMYYQLTCVCSLTRIAEIKNIRTLNLNYNKIRALPYDFDQAFPHLERLYLDDNQLTNLPTSRLSNLLVLSVQCNSITQLPDNFDTMPKLQKLYIARNPCTQITAHLRKHIKKRNLIISRTKLEYSH